jgi:cell division protein FtsI/penicillin-binding protein 2
VALLAIGQGEVLVTVLEVARMASLFANGGRLVEPWVINAFGGRPVSHPAASQSVGWSSQTIGAVVEGMRAVVRQPQGTGHRA